MILKFLSPNANNGLRGKASGDGLGEIGKTLMSEEARKSPLSRLAEEDFRHGPA